LGDGESLRGRGAANVSCADKKYVQCSLLSQRTESLKPNHAQGWHRPAMGVESAVDANGTQRAHREAQTYDSR
jgi:hypothetical protein